MTHRAAGLCDPLPADHALSTGAHASEHAQRGRIVRETRRPLTHAITRHEEEMSNRSLRDDQCLGHRRGCTRIRGALFEPSSREGVGEGTGLVSRRVGMAPARRPVVSRGRRWAHVRSYLRSRRTNPSHELSGLTPGLRPGTRGLETLDWDFRVPAPCPSP